MIAPMLAKAVGDKVPIDPGLMYEPKWDGFRCLIFIDADGGVVLQSRKGEDLAYVFPEVVAICEGLPADSILDGELVIVGEKGLDFDLMSQRIRPRSEAGGWKIAQLAAETPSEYVCFDVLRWAGEEYSDRPFSQRRDLLESVTFPRGIHLTPATDDPATAQEWFRTFEGAGLDGVICKPKDSAYQPGKRTMLKVKHVRTADVVVAGWREYRKPSQDGKPMVGALLLGLYDENGVLHNVGAAGSFSAAVRADMVPMLQSIEVGPDDPHPWQMPVADQRSPGMVSRWTGKKDLSFHPMAPVLVAEVKYDHMQRDRFRHVATFVRWRQDRDPASCTYEQLETVPNFDFAAVLRGQV